MSSRVDHSHFYPRCCLASFATDGMVGMRLVGETASKVVSTKHAGVVTKIYSRTRPDGSRSDDVESSLAHVENLAGPLLRSFDSIWPLKLEKKVILAELFALQLLRGPRRMEWYEKATRGGMAEARAAGSPWSRHNLDATEAHLLTDTQRLMSMIEQHYLMTSIFASMHWTRIDFARPVLASSDHPVVVWPLADCSRQPSLTPLDAGALHTIEVRVPVSPTRAILMTWSDEPDHDRFLTRGRDQHSTNLNAFTIAHANRQWYHLPGTTPRTTSGTLLPLAVQLIPSYGQTAAARSHRRDLVNTIVQPLLGVRTLERNRKIEVVTIT